LREKKTNGRAPLMRSLQRGAYKSHGEFLLAQRLLAAA